MFHVYVKALKVIIVSFYNNKCVPNVPHEIKLCTINMTQALHLDVTNYGLVVLDSDVCGVFFVCVCASIYGPLKIVTGPFKQSQVQTEVRESGHGYIGLEILQ